MEIKVSVEGVQRIVCGVTERTTCQEVVIALAQALGRTGRYTLREKFKEYERNVTPDERLLESLEKYGQQAREVQLTLQHLGPSLGDWTNKPRAQLRRAEGGGRVRRGSGKFKTLSDDTIRLKTVQGYLSFKGSCTFTCTSQTALFAESV
uniref:Ras association domain-containing protein n=1 Tax=Pygocentrus nattereri TaxID=42514 RepID=A0AAR2LVB4_PYGNA